MSILVGLLKERGGSVAGAEIAHLSAATRRYADSDAAVLVRGRLGMGVQPYASHARSNLDPFPVESDSGNVLCLDGRIDNCQELLGALSLPGESISDSALVHCAFERWGDSCFAALTGDWALALWSEKEETLFLARDHAGSRSLYYASTARQALWSTYLDTFTSFGLELRLSRAYAAAYLTCSPARDLTPYQEVRSVLPGHMVTIREEVVTQRAHWNPSIRTAISYKSDSDYDEHFLSVFGTAVSRRTGPGKRVIAQLSGGMDSTSIVCMSDDLRRRIDPNAEILDTISFFDDSEESLDERRYFSITEARRGKVGTHLEIPFGERTFEPPSGDTGMYQTPGRDRFSWDVETALYRAIGERGYRSVLSGIGGDEVLGGIPNGLPELADYLASGHLGLFLRRAVAWSLPERRPLIDTICATARYTARLYGQRDPKYRPIPPWISRELRACCPTLRSRMNPAPDRFGVAPHRLENALTWWQVMETLPHLSPGLIFRPEYRYPMLDKDLVGYLFAVPPEQLVRPGRRRAMMRRALRGIVPEEILERRRKAFQIHGPLHAIRAAQSRLEKLMSQSISAEMGLIEVQTFCTELRRIANGNAQWYQALLRTIAYELWLQIRSRHVATMSEARYTIHGHSSSLAAVPRPSGSGLLERTV